MEQTRETKKFYAFISYKREDERWARWLQHRLEHYRLPANLNGRTDLPKEIRPIFRDTSELLPGNLPQQINDALAASHHLIVICSPHSAQSVWVNKEIETFIAMGKQANIIPFIVDGHPFAQNPDEECFPVAIRNLPTEQELLGANVAEMGREAAAVKTVARMFGIRFDTLWGRYQREQKRRRNWIIAAGVTAFLIVLGVAGYIWKQNNSLKESVSRSAARSAELLIEEGDSYRARRVALEALDMAYTSEAEAALRHAWMQNNAVLRGHAGWLIYATFSPDGKLVASKAEDGTVRVWDAETGQCLKVLESKTEYVGGWTGKQLTFNPDGKQLVTVLSDTILSIWDVESYKCLRKITGHHKLINAVAFSPDGKLMLSSSEDNTIHIWDAKTGNCLRTLVGHTSSVNFAAFSPDGGQIASASSDNTIRIWDVGSSKCLQTIKGHTDQVFSADYSPDGQIIVSASRDSTIRIWNAERGQCLKTIKCSEKVFLANFSPDGKSIVSASMDNTVRIWDVETGECVRAMDGHIHSVASAVFSPDGRRIVSSSFDKTVRIWDIDTVHNSRKLGSGMYAQYSPDGKLIISTNWEDTLFVWDAETRKCIRTLVGGSSFLSPAFFSPDGKYILWSSYDSVSRIWDAVSGELLHTIKWQGVYRGVGFCSDGRLLIVDAGDSVFVWNIEKGECVRTLPQGDFTPDGKLLYSELNDSTYQIFDIHTGQSVKTLKTPAGYIYGFTPDGKRLALVMGDNTICILNALSGEIIHRLTGHEGDICKVGFSPDGNYLITAAWDKTARLWDMATGTCIWTMRSETQVFHASFSPDGSRMAFSFNDGAKPIEIYNFLPLEGLIQKTRAQFKDNPLTPEERRQYYLE